MADGAATLTGLATTVRIGTIGYVIVARFNMTYTGRYSLYAVGHALDVRYGFYGVHGGYSLVARAGGRTKTLELPALSITAHAYVTAIGRLSLSLPQISFTGHAVSTALGKAYLLYRGQYELLTRTGGSAKTGVLPTLTLVAHGINGSSAGVGGGAGSSSTQSTGLLPALTILASATVGVGGVLVAKLPALKVLPSGILRGILPFPTLSAVTQHGVPVDHEAYSVTLLANEQTREEEAFVTHYTDYPFEQIVRFGTKYYGVARDGLFELDGDKFDDQPIIATVETGETDFGFRELKRPISLYLAGRMGADFRVAVTVAEEKTYSYVYHPVIKTGARNYRVTFGKGMRARYVKYSFTNIEGENFEMDELTPEIAALRRTA